RGQGAKQAVDRQQRLRRSIGIDPEKLEHPADPEGIERRFPCSRTGGIPVGVAEALPRARDRPTRPISQPKANWSSPPRKRYWWKTPMAATSGPATRRRRLR